MKDMENSIKEFISNKSNLFSALLGFALGQISLLYSLNQTVPIFVVAIVFVLVFFLIWYLVSKIIRLQEFHSESIIISQFVFQDEQCIALIKQNSILKMDSYVTLYLKKDNFETYLATGIIINIQENGLLQANIVHWKNDESRSDSNINDVSYLQNIVIKSTVTDNFTGGQ